MGILKNLTEEYFGDTLRDEESKMSEIIKANKRKFLLKLYKKKERNNLSFYIMSIDINIGSFIPIIFPVRFPSSSVS